MNNNKIIQWTGDWEFGYTPDVLAVTEMPLVNYDTFETKMPIPGYWDDHKDRMGACHFYGRDARFNPEYRPMEFPMGQIAPDVSKPYLVGTGWYRRNIFIADNLASCAFILQIGPCTMNTAVWCNGQKAAAHIGFLTGFEVDLSKFILPGQNNEIVMAVSNAANDRRSCAIRGYNGRRGGVGDGVKLKIAGKSYIKDFHVRLESEKLIWNVELAGNHTAAELHWSVMTPDGKSAHSTGIVSVTGSKVDFNSEADGLRRWSDNNPQLYRLELTLKYKSVVLDHITRDWGCRELAVSEYSIFLNNQPVYLRGSTEHFYFPKTCNAHWNKAEYKDNIRKLKKVGFNWLRFHTWCPPEPYLAAADEEGMLAQIEVPRYSRESEWEDIIRLCRRHPSVIIFCGGNEDLIDEPRIAELRNMAAMAKALFPDCLFNPQEGLRGVEYGEPESMGEICETPFEHNPRRLNELSAFSDVYGAFNAGFLSYFAGDFDNPPELDRRLAVYGKPCLSHEIGILGNYLNLDLEKRYKNTYTSSELFSEVRKYLKRNGLLDKAAMYYLNSCLITGNIRKHTIENARRCSRLSGYDFLGGTDTHWHRSGYPCGVLNEFYELKPGQSEQDIREYNNESVILLDVGCQRNLTFGEKFCRKIMISYFGEKTSAAGLLEWQLRLSGGKKLVAGKIKISQLRPGEVNDVGMIEFDVPELNKNSKIELKCRFCGGDTELENHWDFWAFKLNPINPSGIAIDKSCRVNPELTKHITSFEGKCNNGLNTVIASRVTSALLEFLINGGNLILTDNFPTDISDAGFQPTPCGRVQGDLATVIYDHPVLNNFPQQGFCDWQFYSLLKDSKSMIFDDTSIPFQPLIEIVSSFKHIRRKASLCEYKVGAGRLMMVSFNFKNEDPAASTLFQELLRYLTGDSIFNAPILDVEFLKRQIDKTHHEYQKIETDCALDPNA